MGRFVYRVDFDLKSGREGWCEHHYFHLEADTIKGMAEVRQRRAPRGARFRERV